jgi:hypothetical protein
MTLPSGAHVQIGAHEFLLDENPDPIRRQDPHYVHRYESLRAQHFDISGMPDKASIRQEKLLWAFDDWSGGEGNRQYYPDDPTVYDYSNGLNGRIRGQLTGRPDRTKATVGASSPFTPTNVQDRPQMCAGGGSLWLVGSREVWESTNGGATFTARSSGITAGRITAACGGFDGLYYAAWNTAAGGTRQLKRMLPGGATVNVLSEADPTGVKGFMGLAMDGMQTLYGWTGKQLWEFRTYAGTGPPLGTTARKVLMDRGIDLTPDLGGTTWWADIVAGENNAVFFKSTAGQSAVWEYRNGAARLIWRPNYGFTIKSMTVQSAIVWIAGHWGGDGSAAGRGAMMAFPLDTLRPEFVGFFRKPQGLNLQMQEMANSYASQILVAGGWTGRIFVYDGDTDGITMLDDLYDDTAGGVFTDNSDKIGCVYTFGTNRFAVRYSPVAGSRTAYVVYKWADDEPANREINTTQYLYSGEWDIGFPMEIKALMGFYLTFKPMVTNQQIEIEYQLDGVGPAGANTWYTTGIVNAATEGNSRGRVYVEASNKTDTKKFYRLRWRIRLTGQSGLQPPILFSATAESNLIAYEQSWELVIRLKDELNRTRPSDRKRVAETVREWILQTIQNKDIVLFRDGYKFRSPGEYDEYDVVIEEPTDVISLAGEGVMRIRLRKTPS